MIIQIDELLPYEPSVVRERIANIGNLLALYGTPGHDFRRIRQQLGEITVVKVNGHWVVRHGMHRVMMCKLLGATHVSCVYGGDAGPYFPATVAHRLHQGRIGFNGIPSDETTEDRGQRILQENAELLGLPYDPDGQTE
jgi:hypothetical protein